MNPNFAVFLTALLTVAACYLAFASLGQGLVGVAVGVFILLFAALVVAIDEAIGAVGSYLRWRKRHRR